MMTDYAIVWSPGGIAMDTHEGTGILPKGSMQAASGARAVAVPASAPARIPAETVFAAFVIPRDERAMPAKF